MQNLAQVVASIVALAFGAAALLWSVILGTGLLAVGYVLVGILVQQYVSDRDVRKRLLDAVVADMNYNSRLAKELRKNAENKVLDVTINLVPLRVAGLFGLASHSASLRFSEEVRGHLMDAIFYAESVNSGLQSLREYRLFPPTAMPASMDQAAVLPNIQSFLWEYSGQYLNAAEALRRDLVQQKAEKPRKTPAESTPPPAAPRAS